MIKCQKIERVRLVLAISLGIFALTLLAPVEANAQVTLLHARVTVSGPGSTAVYCDTGTTCSNQLWNLGSGETVLGGQTLVLTQTGLLSGVGGNFDTSDRVQSVSPTTNACNGGSPCTVTIEFDTGSGFQTVYTNSSGDELTAFNNDQGGLQDEHQPWSGVVASAANYTLKLGYADNAHACTSNCFPNPWDGSAGTTAATFFIGAGTASDGICTNGNCYDAGALLITGVTVAPPGPLTTVTQGGWGSPPHGNNPGAILKANFTSVFGAAGVTIGCPAPGGSLTFTSAHAIQDFLPQGGTPGTLAAGNSTNPTTSAAGVFAGQVLALQLNVDFSGPVFPAGLGSFQLTSGPASGLTVDQVLGLANRALGGCLTAADIALLTGRGITTISQLNDIVDSINQRFD